MNLMIERAILFKISQHLGKVDVDQLELSIKPNNLIITSAIIGLALLVSIILVITQDISIGLIGIGLTVIFTCLMCISYINNRRKILKLIKEINENGAQHEPIHFGG